MHYITAEKEIFQLINKELSQNSNETLLSIFNIIKRLQSLRPIVDTFNVLVPDGNYTPEEKEARISYLKELNNLQKALAAVQKEWPSFHLKYKIINFSQILDREFIRVNALIDTWQKIFDSDAELFAAFKKNIIFICRQHTLLGKNGGGLCRGLTVVHAYHRLHANGNPSSIGITEQVIRLQNPLNNAAHPLNIDFSQRRHFFLKNYGTLICEEIKQSAHAAFFLTVSGIPFGHEFYIEHNRQTQEWYLFDCNFGAFKFAREEDFISFFDTIRDCAYKRMPFYKISPILNINKNESLSFFRRNAIIFSSPSEALLLKLLPLMFIAYIICLSAVNTETSIVTACFMVACFSFFLLHGLIPLGFDALRSLQLAERKFSLESGNNISLDDFGNFASSIDEKIEPIKEEKLSPRNLLPNSIFKPKQPTGSSNGTNHDSIRYLSRL